MRLQIKLSKNHGRFYQAVPLMIKEFTFVNESLIFQYYIFYSVILFKESQVLSYLLNAIQIKTLILNKTKITRTQEVTSVFHLSNFNISNFTLVVHLKNPNTDPSNS